MKKQVVAVVEEVKSVLGDRYDADVPCLDLLTKEEIATISGTIFDGIAAGEIAYGGDVTNTQTLRTYSSGVVTNHLKKCKKLNGNVTYAPSGKGPKRDEQLRELNKALTCGLYAEGTDEHTAIQEAITFRKSELSKTKVKAKKTEAAFEIDFGALSPELQELMIDSKTNEA